MINIKTLDKLISSYSEDSDMMNMIFDALKSFEEYHYAIYEMETKLKVFSYHNMAKEDYQDLVTGLDKRRTMLHNSVLTSVNILNRMAKQLELEPVYSGIVSEEKPYRREVANAVLEYVENIIKQRR